MPIESLVSITASFAVSFIERQRTSRARSRMVCRFDFNIVAHAKGSNVKRV